MSTYNAEECRKGNLIGQWMKKNRKALRLNQKELVIRLEEYGIKVSNGGLSKWETGEHIPTPYQLQALQLALSAHDPFEEINTVTALNDLNETGKMKIASYIEDLRSSGRYRSIPSLTMKIYTMPASAGTGLILEGEDYEMVAVPENEVPLGADFGIKVRGDSMLPRYQDGETVWVKRKNTLRAGDIGIFVLDGEAFIKQLQYSNPTGDEDEAAPVAMLVSLNPEYPPRRIHPDQRLDCVGKVLN